MMGCFVDLLAQSTSTVTFLGGESPGVWSAEDLAMAGRSVAGRLQTGGLVAGDRLGLWMPNGPAYVQALAACSAGGFVAVNVNTRFSLEEARDLMQRSGVAAVVTDRPSDVPDGVHAISLADIESSTAGPATDHLPDADDPFVVFTTSGTTSKPKMVLHRQRSIVEHSEFVAPHFGYTRQTPMLVALPLCGVFGLNTFAGGIAGNAPIWMLDGFDATAAARLIETENIVVANGSDDMFHRMLSTGHSLSTLRIAGYGAFNAGLDNIVEEADAAGASLSGVYGMSEVQALFAHRDVGEPMVTRRLAGGAMVAPSASVRAADPETGSVLEHGLDGELQLRGPSLFAGYLAEGGSLIDPVLTDEAFVDGWFRTGDLGRTHDDGTFTFVTRMGDVLRLGGFLVAPAEIEEVLVSLPGIADAQVVAASTTAGMRPVAFVIADSSRPARSSSVDEAAVIAACAQRLARYKCPVRVVTVDQFPTTDGPNGVKIQRAKLREKAKGVVSRDASSVGSANS